MNKGVSGFIISLCIFLLKNKEENNSYLNY